MGQPGLPDFCHIEPLEVNPLMLGDPLVKVKLMIDGAFRLLSRNCADLKAFNWEVTPASLDCRSNVKYHTREQAPQSLRALG